MFVPCPFCDLTFESKIHFETHKAQVHPSKKYKSFVCTMGSCAENKRNFGPDYASFHDHQFWQHNYRRREFLCPKCPKYFTNASNKKRHLAMVHKESSFEKESFVCENCAKVYKSHKTLANHLPKCTGPKPPKAQKRRAESNPGSAPKAARLDFEDIAVLDEPNSLDEIQPSYLPPTPPMEPFQDIEQDQFQYLQVPENVEVVQHLHQDQMVFPPTPEPQDLQYLQPQAQEVHEEIQTNTVNYYELESGWKI